MARLNETPDSDDALRQRLGELGRVVAEHTEKGPNTERVLAGARRRLQETVREPVRGRRFAYRLAAALALGLAVAGASGFVWRARVKPLTVALESESPALVGAWIASTTGTRQLRFSDGTSVSLHPGSALRVDATTARGATVLLGEGRALAEVEHREAAEWRFLAGPFTVQVTGTAFDLAWDPGSGVLELALHRGSVELSGPTLAGARRVVQGQFVRVELPRPKTEMAAKLGAAPAEEAPREAEKAEDVAGAPPPASAGSVSASGEDWRAHLASGRTEAALAALDREQSLAAALDSANRAQLRSLADAARVGGRPTLARDALVLLRQKHGERGQTAYLLGKVYADQLRGAAEASRWFETYLKEEPAGALAEQALGRLVELQAGTSRGARAAREYLSKYPTGSYAKFARDALRH